MTNEPKIRGEYSGPWLPPRTAGARPWIANLLGWITLLSAIGVSPTQAASVQPPRTEDALHNPHKGFMLWGTSAGSDGLPANHYGSSIFHLYVPWREVEPIDQQFDWAGFESRHIAPIVAAQPNATFVLRLVADYPDGVTSGLTAFYQGGQPERDYPLFLETLHGISGRDYGSCDGDGPGRAPDWDHPQFAVQAEQLVAALGARYDGDPRITAIQVGLLGLWGEWHQSGCESLQPGDSIKARVREAYRVAVTQTPLQTRYPRSPDISGTRFGLHEDYFPSFTASCRYGFPLCSDDGDHSMEWGFAQLNPEARGNWVFSPISGESPLAAQKNAWINDTADIERVLRDYHFSFLGPAGKHEEAGHASVLARLERAVGYNLHVERASWSDPITLGESMQLEVEFSNSGAAPPYHPFRAQLEWVDGAGTTRATRALQGDLREWDGLATRILSASAAAPALQPGSYNLRLRMVDAAAGRPDLILQSGPRDAAGRVVLGSSVLLANPQRVFGSGFESGL